MRTSIRTVPWLLAGAAMGLALAGFNPLSLGTAANGKDPAPKKTSAAPAAPAVKHTAQKPAISPEEQEILNGAEAFEKAYNSHDAKAVAALFADKAEIVDEDGQTVKGRNAIEKYFGENFKAKPQAKIDIQVGTVRMLTNAIAVEEGTVQTTPAPGEAVETSTYLAVNFKMGGKWYVASVKDYDVPASSADMSAHDHLKELAWLVGDWVDESSHATVKSHIDWDESKNFLIQKFQLHVHGGVAMSGTMRIGWDAVSKQFRSWVFDSEGGFVEGVWTRDGDEWIVKSHGSTPQGAAASGTAVYKAVDRDTIAWRSYDRTIGGEKTPDVDEIIIKRQPPKPQH